MNKRYIISDLHFGHKNMASKRGFSTVEEHDEHIIKEWNKVVNKGDTVWILGDITMEKSNYEILDRLHGYKKVVLGNHDMPQHVTKLLKHVNCVCSSHKLGNLLLTHIPIHPSEFDYKSFMKNVHGHVHTNTIQDERYINVCCENIDYKPILIDNLVGNYNKDV